jgi:hypothetical protein
VLSANPELPKVHPTHQKGAEFHPIAEAALHDSIAPQY